MAAQGYSLIIILRAQGDPRRPEDWQGRAPRGNDARLVFSRYHIELQTAFVIGTEKLAIAAKGFHTSAYLLFPYNFCNSSRLDTPWLKDYRLKG